MTPDLRADRRGNVLVEGIVGVQKEVVLASKAALVTVEEVVDDLCAPSPDSVVLPGWTIDVVAVAERGAWPSYAHGYYDRDNAFYQGWDAISRDRDAFRDWMDAPDLTLIYESGTIGARPDVLPLSIGDGELCESAVTTVSVPEMFRYWLQGGRISIGFLGAAQMDRYGNVNTTVIGDYSSPKTRLPGGGGAPEIATHCGEVFVTLRHSRRGLVEKVDFITSLGFGPTGRERRRLGLATRGPTLVITDLCVLESEDDSRELVVTFDPSRSDAREASREHRLGPALRFRRRRDGASTVEELDVLRDLYRRTEEAHGGG